MSIEQAKKKLAEFLGDRVLTFSIKRYESGEWVAECNEIPGIMTGGMGDDIAAMDRMMKDAILTAAGVDTEYVNDVLKFVGYNPSTEATWNLFKPKVIFTSEHKAEYELSYLISRSKVSSW